MEESLMILDAVESRIILALVMRTLASFGKAFMVNGMDLCFGIMPVFGENVKQSEVWIVNRIETSEGLVSVKVWVVSFKVGMKLKSIEEGMLVSIEL